MNQNHQLKLYLIRTLIKYINRYIKKDFYMNQVFVESKQSLKNAESISIEQFDFLIKFIEKEKSFRKSNRNQIRNYFLPVISTEEIITSNNSLEQFMN
jgi:hypothetical protein